MLFAMDVCDETALTSQLISQIKNSAAHWQWYALIDTAFDYQYRQRLDLEGAVSLFTPLPLQILAEVAPVLMPLNRQGDLTVQLSNLLAHCSARPMLSFIALETPVEHLVHAWRNVHLVKTSDDEQYLLRLADTRVQPTLPQALSAEHWAAIRSPLAAWLRIDRFGSLVNLPNAEAKPELPKSLSDDTFNDLLDLAQADAIWDYLLHDEPSRLPAISRAQTAHNWQLISQYAKAQGFDYGLLIAMCRDAIAQSEAPLTAAQITALALPYQQDELEGAET